MLQLDFIMFIHCNTFKKNILVGFKLASKLDRGLPVPSMLFTGHDNENECQNEVAFMHF